MRLCRKGRILKGDGQATEQGLYVVGWAKRGPTGIIGAAFFLSIIFCQPLSFESYCLGPLLP